jgi:hypothetical protein
VKAPPKNKQKRKASGGGKNRKAEGGSPSALGRQASSTAEAARVATVTQAKEKNPKKKLTPTEKQAHGNDTTVESSSALVEDVKSWLPHQTLINGKSQSEMRKHLEIKHSTWQGLMDLTDVGTAENRSTAVKARPSGPRWRALHR